MWVLETGERRDRRCPRCGRTYRADTRPRHRLSTHATQRAACEARSRRLAERFDVGDVYLGETNPHTGEVPTTDPLPEWLVESWPDLWNCDAFADAVDDHPLGRDAWADEVSDTPFYADAFADEAEAYLDRRHGPATRTSEYPGGSADLTEAESPFPWAGDPTGDEKTKLVVTVAASGDSPTSWVPLSVALQAAFDASESRHYERVRHIRDTHPELLEKRTTAGHSEVRATPEALSLVTTMQSLSLPSWLDRSPERDRDTEAPAVRDFRDTLGRQRRYLTASEWGYALSLLADHKKSLQVDGPGAGSKVLDTGAVPQAQRVASVDRAATLGAGFDAAAEALTDRFDRGVSLMLSLPRGVADSPVHSYAVMADAWGRLRDRLGRDREDRDRPAEVPPYVWVQEPQRDGFAHRHVTFGGVTHLMNADDLRADWAECLRYPACGPGPRVHLTTLDLSEGWHAVDHVAAGEAGGRPATAPAVVADGSGLPGLRAYYRKGLTRLRGLAALDAGDCYRIADRVAVGEATDRERDLARLSVMWAAEAPFYGAADRLDAGVNRRG